MTYPTVHNSSITKFKVTEMDGIPNNPKI
jgi:hypothetical protein